MHWVPHIKKISQKKRHNRLCYAAPGYWSAWFSIACIRLLGFLPLSVAVFSGKCLGSLLYCCCKRRKHIATVNIQLCFPQLSARKRRKLVRASFQNTAIELFETAISWTGNLDALCQHTQIVGMEAMLSSLHRGKNIILMGCHQTTLDIGLILFGRKLGSQAELSAVYRVYPNTLLDRFMRKVRTRYLRTLIGSRDTMAMVRLLKEDRQVLWIATDQDVGGKSSVYAPFFGVGASTLVSASRLARVTGAAVFTFASYRQGYRYRLVCQPAPEIPAKNLVQDAITQNTYVAQALRVCPEQYLWTHRRFKTQPDRRNYYQ